MTRAAWALVSADRGRAYRGAHRADTTRSGIIVRPRAQRVAWPRLDRGLAWPRLDRGLPLALILGGGYFAAVAVAGYVGGVWWAVGAALVGVELAVAALAVPSGWWRK